MKCPICKNSTCGCIPDTLDRKERQEIIEAMLRHHPTESNRSIASRLKWLRIDHKTVAKYRDRLAATGELPQLKKLVGKDGKARRRTNRPRNMEPVYTCYRCENAELMAHVARLYFRPGDKIADVTYGLGAFWSKIDLADYDFFPSDLIHDENKFDFTNLPYPDLSFDVVVFDPPHVTKGKERDTDNQSYGHWIKTLYKTSSRLTYRGILAMYFEGICEAARVLKCGGMLLVKCSDEVVSELNRFTHLEVYNFAIEAGLMAQDLFVLHRPTPPVVYGKQRFARKNHSFLWVFHKP